MPERKTISLRELYHDLGNKQYVCLLGSGVLGDALGRMLERQDIPLECKEEIKKAVAGLKKIEKASEQANVLLNEVKSIVYGKVNPDEITTDASVIEDKLGNPPQDKSVF